MFHNRILNLSYGPSYAGITHPLGELGYRAGHRDALHAAAEIGLEADRIVEAAQDLVNALIGCDPENYGRELDALVAALRK